MSHVRLFDACTTHIYLTFGYIWFLLNAWWLYILGLSLASLPSVPVQETEVAVEVRQVLLARKDLNNEKTNEHKTWKLNEPAKNPKNWSLAKLGDSPSFGALANLIKFAHGCENATRLLNSALSDS